MKLAVLWIVQNRKWMLMSKLSVIGTEPEPCALKSKPTPRPASEIPNTLRLTLALPLSSNV